MRRKSEPEYVYMLVTADKYELPMLLASSAAELAKMCGVSKNTVFVEAWRYEQRMRERSRYVRVKLEEGDEE